MNSMVAPASALVGFEWADAALEAMLGRVLAELAPPAPITTLEWAEGYRILSREEANDFPGPFDLENTPVLRGILAECEPGKNKRVAVQKSAQWGYTAGVVCNVLGRHVHWDPCVQVVLFPREKSAKDFDAEKFSPMVRATPVLAERIRLKSRTDGNSATRKQYPGGLAKFVASNSPSDVKSTSAKIVIVEEPDDVSKDVKGQGNAIFMVRERLKTVRNSFELIGGTPTAKGVSEIEKEIRTTDQRRFMVTCHECGDRHSPEWENVVIPGFDLSPEDLSAPDINERYPEREVFGRARWEDAYYVCPHCGTPWTDEERIENIRSAARVPPLYGWEPTVDAVDPGFIGNELLSVFDGSRVPILAQKYLLAHYEYDRGQPEKMVAFWNSSLGRCWEYKGELPEEDELRERALPYTEWSVPAGALVPLLTVDVQHDRLALTCWVVGRGEEMWLAYWGEIYGQTVVPFAGAWIELEQILDKTVAASTGVPLRIVAAGIDCSDGQTSDASYAFCRKHDRGMVRPVLALKGAPDDVGRVEIWTPPRAVDPNRKATKASKFGIQIHQVGTAKAKDLILGWAQEGGRVRLPGNGAGRMHWYQGVRDDFYEQMLSEIKVPSRSNPRIRAWKPRTDRRNEALDCSVYALYLSRHLRLHLRRPGQWDLDELRLRQGVLLPAAVDAPEVPETEEAVQTSVPAGDELAAIDADNEPESEATGDALDLLQAARAKQAWAAALQARKGASRGR